MFYAVIPLMFLWAICSASDYYYQPSNVTRSSLSEIEAYRSELTLDWLAAEDRRQRELAAAFETEASPPVKTLSTDCIGYARPASGKVARLMLELLKNLEGDEGTIVPELIQSLIRNKLLVETSMLDAEPDLDALVKTPGVMMGEPHTTFPRILAMVWLSVTDPVSTKKSGWCAINKVNKYVTLTKPVSIAKHMRALDPIVARARFIMEEFIQHVTPLNMYQRKKSKSNKPTPTVLYGQKTERRFLRSSETMRPGHLVFAQTRSTPICARPPSILDVNDITVQAASSALQLSRLLVFCVVLYLCFL